MIQKLTRIILFTVVGSMPFLLMARKTILEPSYAWIDVPPLGLREQATIDTLYQNYSLEFIPQEVSRAYATTGNYCGSGQNMIFMERPIMSDFYFRDAVSHWLPSTQTIKWYNTRIPMTLLSYNFGGGKQDGQDRFKTIFTANANKRVQIGALIDYIYSKGSYDYQAAKDFTWGFSGSYIGERFELQGNFYHYNLLQKENGGITDDAYIRDPASVQGGNTSVNCKDIPVNLTGAFNRVRGTDLYLNSRYKMGFWKEEQINDTTVTRTLIPVTSIIWTLNYSDGTHRFINNNAPQNTSFWENTYFSPDFTKDTQEFWKLQNTVGLSLLEGFNKYAKAGLSAFITHQVRSYKLRTEFNESDQAQAKILTPDPYPSMITSETQNLAWIGAQLTKQQGRIFNYTATGEIGVLGAAAGEIKVNGEISTRIPLFGDTVQINANGHFTNLTAPWLMQHMKSNHFIWDNNFAKTRSLRFGGELIIPWTRTSLSLNVENLQNSIYFGTNGLPRQYGGSAQIISATLRQNFKFGPFHWDNTITYQTSSENEVIPLPNLTVYSNMYLLFHIATLHVQLGLNCDYFTKYKGVNYQPATMGFYNQNLIDIGDYPFVSIYANCKLSKCRFYVMMSHVNQGMTGSMYFSMPHYPMNPRRLQMGLSIDFAN